MIAAGQNFILPRAAVYFCFGLKADIPGSDANCYSGSASDLHGARYNVRCTFNSGNSASKFFATPLQPHPDPPSEHAASCDTEQDHTNDRDNPRTVGPTTFTDIALRRSPYTH